MNETVKAKQGTKHKSEQERRTQILQCAMEVFLNNGYHKATMKEIMAATGLSKGAIYHYFSGKEQIFNAIIHDFVRQLKSDFGNVATSEDPLLGVKELVYMNLDELIRFHRMSIVCLEMTENDLVQQSFDECSRYIRECMTKAINEKYNLSSGVKIDDVITSFYLMIEGILSMAATQHSFDARNEMTKVLRVIDHLLEVPEANKTVGENQK